MMKTTAVRAGWAASGLAAIWLSVGGCATNPATGGRQLMLMSEQQEIAIGQEEDRNVVQSMGLYDDASLQAYVEELGLELARSSERPQLPWSFKVIDDPVVNAFALPGGYIYITRGILAHMGSEAQLVSVLGHEIGHVTARHSANRLSKAQLASIGLGLGAAVSPEIAQAAGLLEMGTGLLFLKFSRDDERQADDLGLRYAAANGFDLHEGTEVHRTLKAISSESGTGAIPGWAATHPTSDNRIARMQQRIAEMGKATEQGTIGRERYLRYLDGLTYGENPREGFFDGNRYYHPDLAFRFDVPRDWQGINQRRSAGALSPDKDAAVVLTLAEETDLMAAAQRFVRESGASAESPRRGQFNGLPAVWLGFEAMSGSTPVSGRIAFVRHGRRTYELLGYTASRNWSRYQRDIDMSLQSFAKVTDSRILNAQPAKMSIVEISRSMTLREFDSRYPSSIGIDQLAVLNQTDPDVTLPAGELVKRVVGGPQGR